MCGIARSKLLTIESHLQGEENEAVSEDDDQADEKGEGHVGQLDPVD